MFKTTSFRLAIIIGAISFLSSVDPVLGQNIAFVPQPQALVYGDTSTNALQFWNTPTFFRDSLDLFNGNLGEDIAPFSIEVADSCTAAGAPHYRFILEMDLDGNGQRETRVDSDNLPTLSGAVAFKNMLAGNLGTTMALFDNRPVAPNALYNFFLAVDSVSPTVRRLRIAWKANNSPDVVEAQLPYGNHRVEWTATNACGVTAQTVLYGRVKDVAPPVIVCPPFISANLMNVQGGLIQLFLSDLVTSIEDNYSPQSHIQSLLLDRVPNGLPALDGQFPGSSNFLFTACNLGLNECEIWVMDRYRNKAKCEIDILIQDNAGFDCFGEITGYVTTETGAGVEDVSFELTGNPSYASGLNYVAVTGSIGQFEIGNASYWANPSVTIDPQLNLDHLNGVNIWDLVLISRHILGLAPLNSPYKLISADANKSGTVTAFDIVEIRKLILGSYSKYPNNTSWRFVDRYQMFNDLANPFADTLREKIVLPSYYARGLHFIGCKIGDVDLSATPNNLTAAPQDRNGTTAAITTKDIQLVENETITIPFQVESTLEGYQMTLDLGPLEIEEIIAAGGLTDENFAQYQKDGRNMLAIVSELPEHRFSLRVRAPRTGTLSQWLRLDAGETQRPSVGFDREGTARPLALALLPTDTDAPYLMHVAPNPFSDRTQITFHQPQEGAVVLRIFDTQGRLVSEQAQDKPQGTNSIEVKTDHLTNPGIYRFILSTNNKTLNGSLIKH
jgi:hypothetical protein